MTHGNRTLHSGNGEEVAPPGRGGVPRGDLEGSNCLRSPLLPGHLIQVPGATYFRKEWWLASSGAQPLAHQEEVDLVNLGAKQGRSWYLEIGTDLFGGGAIGPSIRVRDMGPDTAYAEDVGMIPPYGSLQDDRWNCKRNGKEARFTPCWRMRWQRRDFKRWIPTCPVSMALWPNIQLGPLWTCVWPQSGGQSQ